MNLVSLSQNETEVSCQPKSSTKNKTILGFTLSLEFLQVINKKIVKTQKNLYNDMVTIYENEKKYKC